jgi:hypothetical protein
VFFVKVTDIPGKKRGRYIPKFYVFRGFHLSKCKTLLAPIILIDRTGIRLSSLDFGNNGARPT